MPKLSAFALSCIFGVAQSHLVTIVAKDDTVVSFDTTTDDGQKILKHSGLLHNLLEEVPEGQVEPIKMDVVNADDITRAFAYFTLDDSTQTCNIITPFKDVNLDSWGFNKADVDYTNQFNDDIEKLKHMIHTANFLQAESLLKVLSSKLASLLMKKTQIEKLYFLNYKMDGEVEVSKTPEVKTQHGVLAYRTGLLYVQALKTHKEFMDNIANPATPVAVLKGQIESAFVSEKWDKELKYVADFIDEQEKANANTEPRPVESDIAVCRLAMAECEEFHRLSKEILADMNAQLAQFEAAKALEGVQV